MTVVIIRVLFQFCEIVKIAITHLLMHPSTLLRYIFVNQDYQMVCFQTKNPNLSKFWKALGRLENVYTFYGHLEYSL
jgi:hypothetical protein